MLGCKVNSNLPMISQLINSELSPHWTSPCVHGVAFLWTQSLLFLLSHHSQLLLLLSLLFLKHLLWFTIILATTIWWCSSGILVFFFICITLQVKSSHLMVLYIVCILLALKCSPLTCTLNSRLLYPPTYFPWPKPNPQFPPQNLFFQSFHHLVSSPLFWYSGPKFRSHLWLHSLSHSPHQMHQLLPLLNIFKMFTKCLSCLCNCSGSCI